MFGLSWWHVLLVLVVFVLLFGSGRISSLMADTAKGLKSFKKGLADTDDDANPETMRVEHKRNQDNQTGASKAAKRPRKTA